MKYVGHWHDPSISTGHVSLQTNSICRQHNITQYTKYSWTSKNAPDRPEGVIIGQNVFSNNSLYCYSAHFEAASILKFQKNFLVNWSVCTMQYCNITFVVLIIMFYPYMTSTRTMQWLERNQHLSWHTMIN